MLSKITIDIFILFLFTLILLLTLYNLRKLNCVFKIIDVYTFIITRAIPKI